MIVRDADTRPTGARRLCVVFCRPVLRWVLPTIIVGLLLVAHGLFRELDHDEHQFVASGALLARHGLLPYRDYPYFHVPYLVFIYAAIFSATDHLLLAASLCSIFCSIATIVLIA